MKYLVIVALFVASMTMGVVDDSPESWAVAYFFDESEGNTLNDESFNGIDGTIFGANWSGGLYGHALIYDGSDYVEAPHSSELDFGVDEFSIVMWVNPVAIAGNQSLIDMTDGVDGYRLYITDAGTVKFVRGGLLTNAVETNRVVAPGEWNHIAAVVNISGSDKVEFYINGTPAGSGLLGSSPASAVSVLRLGRPTFPDLSLQNFNGTMDEFRIFPQALTQEDAQLTMNTSVEGNPPPVDSDDDGIPDSEDDCPFTDTLYQVNEQGCPTPLVSEFSPQLTTDFTNLDLLDMTGLQLGIVGVGILDFGSANFRLLDNSSGVFTPVDLDGIIDLTPERIDLDSSQFPALNTNAIVTLSYSGQSPHVLKDGLPCDNCSILSYTNGEVTFTVPHFTEYRIEEGTFCGELFCSPLEGCAICAGDCGTCASGGGSGGGGGGGGMSAPTIMEEVDPVSGATLTTYEFFFSELDISRIAVTLNNQKDISLDVSEPVNVPTPNVAVYKTYSIEPVGFSQLDIEGVEMDFFVDKSWLEENQVGKVDLFRLSGGWETIPASRLREIDGKVEYSSQFSGLSIFAVGGVRYQEPSQGTQTGTGPGEAESTMPGIDLSINDLLIPIVIIVVLLLVYVFATHRHSSEHVQTVKRKKRKKHRR